MLQDLSFARRALAKHPLVTAAAVVTLALGIGANTASFAVIKAIFVDPFVFHDQKNTVIVFSENAGQRALRQPMSIADFRDFRERTHSFDQLAMVTPIAVALTGLKEPERITAARASSDFFGFFDFRPTLGRAFVPEEYRTGAPHAAIVSNTFWKTHLGRDRAAIGRMIRIDGEQYTIVGVAPADFWIPTRATSLWLPLPLTVGAEDRASRAGIVLGHLRPGTSLQQANQDLNAAARSLASEYPLADAGWSARAYAPLEAVMGPNDGVLLGVIFAVVGALLLVACSNVANLLLAQAAARRREMAIRTAVGATRWHLMKQSLCESLLLASMAGVLGLLASLWAKDAFVAIYPSTILMSAKLVDVPLLAFCLGASLLSTMVFGLIPAWDSARGNAVEALKEARSSGARSHRLAGAFVSSQIALSVILLIVTGLLLETVRHLRHLELGFRPGHMVVARLQPSPVRHGNTDQLRAFYRSAGERVAALGQVQAVSASSVLPVFQEGAPVHVSIPGEPVLPAERATAMRVSIAPRFFEVAGIPMLHGREFNALDKDGSPRVAIVNQAFVDRFSNGKNAVGQAVRVGDSDAAALWSIVGVSANLRPPDIQGPAHPQIYIPFDQAPQRDMALLVKTAGDPAALVSSVRKAIAGVDPDEPVDANTMSQLLLEQLRSGEIIVSMLLVFAGLGVAMASIGLFALVAYSVNERLREMGIRIALGATRGDLVRLVVGRGLKLAGMGMAVGLVISAAVSRSLGALLIETSPWDARTFLGVSVLLAGIAALASYVPARRAMRVDPMMTLRQE